MARFMLKYSLNAIVGFSIRNDEEKGIDHYKKHLIRQQFLL